MNLLSRLLYAVRTLLGLGNASDDHPTPSHGWLLPAPQAAPAPRQDD